jgi:hypothetical protein
VESRVISMSMPQDNNCRSVSNLLFRPPQIHGFGGGSIKLTEILPVINLPLKASEDNRGNPLFKDGFDESSKSIVSLHGQLRPESDGRGVSSQICR